MAYNITSGEQLSCDSTPMFTRFMSCYSCIYIYIYIITIIIIILVCTSSCDSHSCIGIE